MIYARSGADALSQRNIVMSPGTGNQHWGTVFFGPRTSKARAPGPQATMSELNANETILAHFHGVTMFQVFLAGNATIGTRGQVLEPLMVQFKDHHTAYGPITAGPQGLAFVALRMYTGDSEPIYISKPGAKEKLMPSKRRNMTSSPIRFSVEPLMQSRAEPVWETIFEETDDGMHAQVVRLGANRAVDGPDPKRAGGYYVLVGNGSLVHEAEELPLWSMVVVEPGEAGYRIQAGPRGVEALVLQYPRSER